MGIFEYECPDGHVTERHVNHYDKPAEVPCSAVNCGKTAGFVLSPTKTTFHANDRKAIKRSGH